MLALKRKGKKHMLHRCTIKCLARCITNRAWWPHSCIAKAEAMKIEEYIPSVSYNGTQ